MPTCGPGTGSPLLFVYELPSSYQVRGRHARAGNKANFSFEGYPFSEPLDGHWMYDVASIYLQRALAYACRTTDPLTAEIFFVPAYNTEMTPRPTSNCAEPQGPANHHMALYNRMRTQAGDAFMRRGGADHFFVNPRPGAGYFESHPVCELNLLDSRLGSAARLSIEQTPPAEDLPPRGPFAYHPHGSMISVPYPSWVRLPSARDGASKESAPWRARHVRPVRIAAAFSVTVGGNGMASKSFTVHDLRVRLRELCLANAPGADGGGGCRYLLPSAAGGSTVGPPQWRGFNSQAASLYWHSSFCLMPGGDSVTRKALFDALLLGCIPVLFHRGQIEQYDWHWSGWRANATVVFNAFKVVRNESDPIAELLAMPESRIRHMRAVLAANAHRMHYARGAGTGSGRGSEGESPAEVSEAEDDAFTLTLRGVRDRAADPGLIRDGRKAQAFAITPADAATRVIRSLGTTVGARDGICKMSSGSFTASSCVDNSSAPWLPPRPLVKDVRGHGDDMQAIKKCVDLCAGCARCRSVSYSLILGQCAWHHSCDPEGHASQHLDKRWELWSYRSFRLNETTRAAVYALLAAEANASAAAAGDNASPGVR